MTTKYIHIRMSKEGRGLVEAPPVIFIAGRPKAALLFWFFGDFSVVIYGYSRYINIKIGKNSC